MTDELEAELFDIVIIILYCNLWKGLALSSHRCARETTYISKHETSILDTKQKV